MGNLGSYQAMVELAKKVGGPFALAAVTALSGWVVGRGAEAGGKAVWKRARARGRSLATTLLEDTASFTVSTDTDCGSGLSLHAGDKIRILERDGDAVLIEVIDDADNPYVVSAETLMTVSDFDSPKDQPASR